MSLVYNLSCNILDNTRLSAKPGWARLNGIYWNKGGFKRIRKCSSSCESLSFPCLSDFVLKLSHTIPKAPLLFWCFPLNSCFASAAFPHQKNTPVAPISCWLLRGLLLSPTNTKVGTPERHLSVNVLLMFLLRSNTRLAPCVL